MEVIKIYIIWKNKIVFYKQVTNVQIKDKLRWIYLIYLNY